MKNEKRRVKKTKLFGVFNKGKNLDKKIYIIIIIIIIKK
jgi:hypothetical protein